MYLDINALVGLDPDDQFVPDGLAVEYVARHLLVLNPHLDYIHVKRVRTFSSKAYRWGLGGDGPSPAPSPLLRQIVKDFTKSLFFSISLATPPPPLFSFSVGPCLSY